ncbi:MAG: hypothetical protein AAGF87_03070 [Bacteroidota bacterium]
MHNSQEEKFDELLRESLAKAADQHTPIGWEQLSSRLSDVPASFDDQVREKLDEVGKDLPVSGWDQLAQRIDKERTATADKHVKAQLVKTSAHSETSGWAALAARLELIAHRRQSLAAFKITELSLVLSLLLLFWRFGVLPQPNQDTRASIDPLEEPQQTTYAQSDQEVQTAFPQHHAISEDGTSAGLQALAEVANAQPSLALPLTEPASSPDIEASNQTQVHNPLSGREIPELANQLKIGQIDLADNRGASQALPGQIFPVPNAMSLASLGVAGLQIPKEDKGIHTYLRLFYSPVDLNQVITPQNEFLDRIIEADDRFTFGQSGGVLVDIASKHFSLHTGLIYGLRSYIPTLLKLDDRDEFPLVIAPNRSGYSRLTFHTASIPLTINGTLLDNDKWRITLGGGVGLTMVLKSSFVKLDGADEVLNDLLNTQLVPQGRGSIQERVDAKEYFNPEPGWFQGGSIFSNANFYLTGTASFERKLGDRFSVFASPTISRYLHFVQKGGLGPNYDRIHNHAVYFGTRIRLGTVE